MAQHSIVHVEIPTRDQTQSSEFYAKLFGWETKVDQEFNYAMFQPQAGPGGAFVQIQDDPTQPSLHYKVGEVLVYISTDDVEASLKQAEALGGTIVTPAFEIPHTGSMGIFTDPAGNRIALFHMHS